MEKLERDFKNCEESYGDNMLNLTLARSYVKRILENARVVRFLTNNHPDIFAEFESIAAADALFFSAAKAVSENESGVSGVVYRGTKGNPIVTGFLPILWAHGARIVGADGKAQPAQRL